MFYTYTNVEYTFEILNISYRFFLILQPLSFIKRQNERLMFVRYNVHEINGSHYELQTRLVECSSLTDRQYCSSLSECTKNLDAFNRLRSVIECKRDRMLVVGCRSSVCDVTLASQRQPSVIARQCHSIARPLSTHKATTRSRAGKLIFLPGE